MAKGDNTRSGLLWEVERLLNECEELPQILLMENVTQVHGTKNKEHFDAWIEFLESKGYSNYWNDLNAKNFGIPQNRNRTFMVSVLGDYTYEFPKEFPLELRLKDMLEDSVDEKFYLSDAMINYFTENTIKQREKGNGFKFQPTDGSGCGKAITTRAGGRMDDNFIEEQPILIGGMQKNQSVKKDGVSTSLTASMGMGGGYVPIVTEKQTLDPIRLGGIFDTETSKHQAGAIWDKNALAPTVDTMQGGYRQPLITEEPKVKRLGNVYNEKFTGCSFGGNVWDKNGLAPTLKTTSAASQQFVTEEPKVLGGIGEKKSNGGTQWYQQDRIYDDNIAISVTTAFNPYYAVQKDEIIDPFIVASRGRNPENPSDRTAGIPTEQRLEPNFSGCTCALRIRKLTPKECWRLMGFDDSDFEKAEKVNSNSQLYKQAGNSIVVDVLCYIFKEML